MDAIAADLGLDRTVVRERNFIQPDQMPFDQGLVFQDGRPLVYDSGDFPASLAKLKELVGWDDFPAFREQAAAEGRHVGIGVACYVEGTGVGPYEGGHIRVETDGSVVVSTGLTSQGQGHQTAFAQIVADELGVPMSDIEVVTVTRSTDTPSSCATIWAKTVSCPWPCVVRPVAATTSPVVSTRTCAPS